MRKNGGAIQFVGAEDYVVPLPESASGTLFSSASGTLFSNQLQSTAPDNSTDTSHARSSIFVQPTTALTLKMPMQSTAHDVRNKLAISTPPGLLLPPCFRFRLFHKEGDLSKSTILCPQEEHNTTLTDMLQCHQVRVFPALQPETDKDTTTQTSTQSPKTETDKGATSQTSTQTPDTETLGGHSSRNSGFLGKESRFSADFDSFAFLQELCNSCRVFLQSCW